MSNQRTKAGLVRQRSSPIDRAKFLYIRNSIRDAIAEDVYNADDLAYVHKVGASTIRVIRRVQTWPAFEAYKKAQQDKRDRQSHLNRQHTNDRYAIPQLPQEFAEGISVPRKYKLTRADPNRSSALEKIGIIVIIGIGLFLLVLLVRMRIAIV